MTTRSRVWTYVALGTVGAALGVWLVTLWLPGWLVATRPTNSAVTPSVTETAPAGDTRRISATLFYVSPSGDALMASDQEVPYASAPAEQARRIVERQLAAPPAGQVSAIPAGTTLRALFLTGRGEAYVDVSREIITGHPGGSLYESLTIYSIVNAITTNMPEITAVQVLVDGREVDTLVGHLDLRHPLRRGIRWVQRTQ